MTPSYKYYARPIPSGYEFREGGETLAGDVFLTADQFSALTEERAIMAADGQIIYPDQVA